MFTVKHLTKREQLTMNVYGYLEINKDSYYERRMEYHANENNGKVPEKLKMI